MVSNGYFNIRIYEKKIKMNNINYFNTVTNNDKVFKCSKILLKLI